MKLYLFRHAPAQERHVFAQTELPDDLRPLTDKGIQRMREVLQVFRNHESQIDLILQSPLTRATETGSLVKEFFPHAQVQTTDHLKPYHSAELLFAEIQKHAKLDSIALIGHEPDLGQFISWLLFGYASDHFPMKKAGVAKIDIYSDGRRFLKWMLRPRLITNSKI